MVVYSADQGKTMMVFADSECGTLTLSLPSEWADHTVQVWSFVRTSVDDVTPAEVYGIVIKLGDCSPSTYVGTGTVVASRPFHRPFSPLIPPTHHSPLNPKDRPVCCNTVATKIPNYFGSLSFIVIIVRVNHYFVVFKNIRIFAF